MPHPLSISRRERACGGSYSQTAQQRRRALHLLSIRAPRAEWNRRQRCFLYRRCPPCFTSDPNPKRTSGTPTRSLQLAPIIWNGQLLAPRNAPRNQIDLCGIAPHRTRLRLVAIPCNGSVLPLGNSSLGSQLDPIGSVGYLLIDA